ncbi:acyl-CoA dehydrogenase/oxidase C-terminal [Mycena leptocephala]|nr:acyl-CoA dehydrogenase/oxidase C-terminal [Mycena leptocephala]
MRPSQNLCSSFHNDLLKQHIDPDGHSAFENSYLRAEATAHAYALSLSDIMSLSQKFWDMHTDPILVLDGAATTLLTIQYNLVVGTLGGFMHDRSDVSSLIDDLIGFKSLGQFCLTEVTHGLDVFNLETTATVLQDGRIELHTPHAGAAKCMPPTNPILGRPCFAVVFARLIVNGQSRGIRPFLVRLNDGFKMSTGISASILPFRGNSCPVAHCLTSFHRVILPSSALLGESDMPGSARLHFLSTLWRIAVGTLSLGVLALPGLQMASHIALRYSLRRMIRGHDGTVMPIFSFRTQQIPICTAIAQTYVLKAFQPQAVKFFLDSSLGPFVQHGIATSFKAIAVRDSLTSLDLLAERCGAQGIFGFNQITLMHGNMQGIAIAEGDVLVLSIRLATELLLERYSMPPTNNPRSLLSLYEDGIMEEYRSIIVDSGGHRSAKYASHVLPHCEGIVRAIGYRMAYDAAVSAQVPQSLIDLYLCNVVKGNLAWYIQHQLLSRDQLADMEHSAIQRSLPHIEKWVADMHVDAYINAPIVSSTAWEGFTRLLKHSDAEFTAKL